MRYEIPIICEKECSNKCSDGFMFQGNLLSYNTFFFTFLEDFKNWSAGCGKI